MGYSHYLVSHVQGRKEGGKERWRVLPSLLTTGVEMSLTGPACEEGEKERGKKDPGYFLGLLATDDKCSQVLVAKA